MPLHDWTRVEAGVFHDFHTVWIGELRTALNDGLLPNGYYALAEQHAGEAIADVLTLHTTPASLEPMPLPPATGGIAVAEVRPRVRRRQTIDLAAVARRRTLAVRHVSGHRLIAILEIVSPANKDRPSSVATFAEKVHSALRAGVHASVVDLFSGPHDPGGMHGAILQTLQQSDEVSYEVPPDEPATLASYVFGPPIDIYVEHAAVGATLPDMALFVRPDRYVSVPLEATYQAAYRGLPRFWRDVVEGVSP